MRNLTDQERRDAREYDQTHRAREVAACTNPVDRFVIGHPTISLGAVGLVLLLILSLNPMGLTEWLGGALYRIFLGVTGQGDCPEPAYGWPVQC